MKPFYHIGGMITIWRIFVVVVIVLGLGVNIDSVSWRDLLFGFVLGGTLLELVMERKPHENE